MLYLKHRVRVIKDLISLIPILTAARQIGLQRLDPFSLQIWKYEAV